MSAEPTQLSAHEAARVLAELPRYEEALTAKAFAVTVITFGIASAAIGLTYEVATPWFVDAGVPWLLSLLWMPWILSAVLVTGIVWHAQSISIGATGDDEPGGAWRYGVGFSAVYLALFGGFTALRAFTAWSPDDRVLDLYVLGLFTGFLATFFTLRHSAGRLARPMVAAALAIVVAAAGADLGGLANEPATLFRTGVALLAYVVAGLMIARRG